MFDLLVFICAVAFVVLGISLAVSVVIGRLFRRNEPEYQLPVNGFIAVVHASWCNADLDDPGPCVCDVRDDMRELMELNDSLDHEERVTLVSYLRECPCVSYVSADVWVVDDEGGVWHA